MQVNDNYNNAPNINILQTAEEGGPIIGINGIINGRGDEDIGGRYTGTTETAALDTQQKQRTVGGNGR